MKIPYLHDGTKYIVVGKKKKKTETFKLFYQKIVAEIYMKPFVIEISLL